MVSLSGWVRPSSQISSGGTINRSIINEMLMVITVSIAMPEFGRKLDWARIKKPKTRTIVVVVRANPTEEKA